MRNYALTEEEANTARAALLIVQHNLDVKKQMREQVIPMSVLVDDPDYKRILDQQEKVKTALDALK